MPIMAMSLWAARGPRFLVLLLGLWVLVRIASHWPGEGYPVAPVLSPIAPPLYRETAPDFAEVRNHPARPALVSGIAARAPARTDRSHGILPPPSIAPDVAPQAGSGYSGSQRHAWRLALLGGLGVRPGGASRQLALPQPARNFAPGLVPMLPHPRWPVAGPGRWSLAAAVYWRGGGTGTPTVGPDTGVRLGGSQTAVRLNYVIDPKFALRAYARVTHSPGPNDGVDIAVGAALRPLRTVPIDVHVERRTVLAGRGRDTTLVYAAGGVDNRQLPHDFRLTAYGQAGLADYGAVVGFADGAVVVQHDVAKRGGVRLSLGTIVAAAAQPGARRVDIGPRAALLLPDIGQGAQVTLDWRERVAGNARPGSGLALTLATDF